MIKRILITFIVLINSGAIHAQQYTAKDLIGRWQDTRHKLINILFLTDSTAAWIMNDGLVNHKINYTTRLDKDIVRLKYTPEVDRQSPRYAEPYIKFLNDSTFLMRSLWGIPKNADTTNKKVSVFVKVKNPAPGTEMRLPSYKELLGQWVLMFKNEPRSSKLNFIDSNRVIKITATSATLMDYVVDFTKQPITMDFYVKGQLINQAYWVFNSRNDARIEYFDAGKRKDHFTIFGQNYMYRREKPL